MILLADAGAAEATKASQFYPQISQITQIITQAVK
jgi:hypothetical protein